MTDTPMGECGYVASYLEELEKFGSNRSAHDLDRISAHVNGCASCHEQLKSFFHLVGAPESDYLRETVDDLTEAIYNLVKALIKRPGDQNRSDYENVRFLTEPEDPDRYVEESAEMIDDVQDYTGSDTFNGESMEGIRNLIENSPADFRFARMLLQKAVDLDGRHSLDCRNLKGILYLEEERFDEAEAEFRGVVGAKPNDNYGRTVQVHALSNLAYVYRVRGDLDRAIRCAERSQALAEELGMDTFNPRFALAYFHLLRAAPSDLEAARAIVRSLTVSPEERACLTSALSVSANQEIKELYDKNGLTDEFVTGAS